MKETTIKVLICDDSADSGVRIASSLRESDIFAYTRKPIDNTIVNSILLDAPDVVVTDFNLQDTNALHVMEEVRSTVAVCPQFIILLDEHDSFIERHVFEKGAAYMMVKPIDVDKLLDVIKLVTVKKTAPDCGDAEIMVTDLIRSLGIPAHIKGYRYIRTAVLECLNSHMLLECITKSLYPRVAEIYQTTPARVERAIRHAIEAAWDRKDKEVMSSFFGCNIDNFHGRPTNSEFIALATDRIGLSMKNCNQRNKSLMTNFSCF
ncbi:MAG: sporulation transcription factor Spo0A [Ruminococcus sp.]|nr:sporulation transcription factor Spo0A [Ruminococcus sp.]